MPTSWFICSYQRNRLRTNRIIRFCSISLFASDIEADGGHWEEMQIPKGRALVKVSASATTLAKISETIGFYRFPLDRLDNSFSNLTIEQRMELRSLALKIGYSESETDASLPDFTTITLRDFLRFLSQRYHLPRYDIGTDEITDADEDTALNHTTRLDTIDRGVR